MTREMRYRFIGVFFFMFLAGNLLLLTKSGQQWIQAMADPESGSGRLLPILSLVAVLLTAEWVGYLMSAWFYRLWLWCGGWSAFWKDLGLKASIMEEYKRQRGNATQPPSASSMLQSLSHDIHFSYIWQGFPEARRDWAIRRHVAFVSDCSILTAMWLAYAFAALLSVKVGNGNTTDWWIAGVCAVLAGAAAPFFLARVLHWNALRRKTWLPLLLLLLSGVGTLIGPYLVADGIAQTKSCLWAPAALAIIVAVVLFFDARTNLIDNRRFVELCITGIRDRNLQSTLRTIEGKLLGTGADDKGGGEAS